MVATVFIGDPNGLADHFFDHAPSATVEGDLLTALERGHLRKIAKAQSAIDDAGGGSFDGLFSLSHGSIIAENGGKASFLFVFSLFYFCLFFAFCLTRKSLSVNELRFGKRSMSAAHSCAHLPRWLSYLKLFTLS
jgi:hypothetical protein